LPLSSSSDEEAGSKVKGTGKGKKSKAADSTVDPGASGSRHGSGMTTPPHQLLPASVSTPQILARHGKLSVIYFLKLFSKFLVNVFYSGFRSTL